MSKLPIWLLAAGASAAALAYGYFSAELRTAAPLVLLAMGGLVLALCGMALLRMLDPLLRPAAAAARAESARESVRVRELTHEKQLVLKAIREIEHDYQMRKISEPDYKELSSRYRARAMRLIREIDAGDDFRGLIEQELKTRLGALQAAASRKCPTCSTGNEPDARFCKKCGGALPPASAPTASQRGEA
jgi:hypothetical protein